MSKDTVIKSVFRRREVETIYKIYMKDCGYVRPYFVGNKKINIQAPQLWFKSDTNVLSDTEIGRYDVEIPLLEVGDEFFLHDINEVVKIQKRVRSSDGSITYFVNDKYVETDNSKKSYDECIKKIENWEIKAKQYDDLETEFYNYRQKYKYKNRFFNIKKADCTDIQKNKSWVV